jgi:hypothetical protein
MVKNTQYLRDKQFRVLKLLPQVNLIKKMQQHTATDALKHRKYNSCKSGFCHGHTACGDT